MHNGHCSTLPTSTGYFSVLETVFRTCINAGDEVSLPSPLGRKQFFSIFSILSEVAVLITRLAGLLARKIPTMNDVIQLNRRVHLKANFI